MHLLHCCDWLWLVLQCIYYITVDTDHIRDKQDDQESDKGEYLHNKVDIMNKICGDHPIHSQVEMNKEPNHTQLGRDTGLEETWNKRPMR